MRHRARVHRYQQAAWHTHRTGASRHPRARRWVLAVLLTLVCTAGRSAGAAPNFVVILTDDQSWVGTSLQMLPADSRTKSDYYRTPHIERLAAMGMTFSQGYAPAASCTPTRRSILVGQNPARHIYSKDQQGWTAHYRQQLSIPRMLKAADPGYRTAHFGKWDLRADRVTPEQMGFDASDGYTQNSDGEGKHSAWPAVRDDPKSIRGITDRATRFMAEQAATGHPFYVQVSHYAVHLGIFYRAQTLAEVARWPAGHKHRMPEFAAMTADLDTGVGQLLDSIAALGLAANTYIFFLSDNGGRTTIRGETGRSEPRNSPLRAGKQRLYEGGIRVPFLVAGPGISARSVSNVAVTGLDLLPTLAALAGYRGQLPASVDGGSMTAVLANAGVGVVKRQQPFLAFHQAVDKPAQSALILGDYKLVKSWAHNRLELFNLAADIGETTDLSKRLPDKTAQMQALLERYLAQVGAQTQGQPLRRRGDRTLPDVL